MTCANPSGADDLGGRGCRCSWKSWSARDPLEARAIEQMLVGVSTRKYRRSLEEVPDEGPFVGRGTSQSAVSRRFVRGTAKKLPSKTEPPGELIRTRGRLASRCRRSRCRSRRTQGRATHPRCRHVQTLAMLSGSTATSVDTFLPRFFPIFRPFRVRRTGCRGRSS